MTIFYFTSTGNSLAVAKRIGGDLISIPQAIRSKKQHYKDDVIGIVFPIYGWAAPKMVRRFLKKVKLEADYTFAIATYGAIPGAAIYGVRKLAKKQGYSLDYTNQLLMVDNYLPLFDMEEEKVKLPKKKTEKNLARIVKDIKGCRHYHVPQPLLARVITSFVEAHQQKLMRSTQAQGFIIQDTCTKCGTCARVCPSGNITVSDTVYFGTKCENCLGCIHLCPQNSLHLKNEKSAKRWRNSDVDLKEIIAANNRKNKDKKD